MGRKGFTLIEVIISLSLLGLISVTTIPIISSSFINLRNHNIKMKMNYIGEMVVEKIKAFDEEHIDLSIYDIKVAEIIDVLKSSDSAKFSLNKNDDGEAFLIDIEKEIHSDKIWKVSIYVYHDNERSTINHVEYKTYLPKK